MLGQIVNLGMAIMARGDAVIRTRLSNLVKLDLSIMTSGVGKPGLEVPAAAATAIIIGFVGVHIHEVFFPNNSLDYKTEIVRNWIAEGLSDQITGILSREFHLQILVPVGIDLQFPFPDPLGIHLNDAFDFEIMFYVEFFQSGPDCK
jgi:hypothetical protein